MFVHIIWVLPHSDIKRAKINFVNMLKIIRKLGQPLNLLDFRIIFSIFAKLWNKDLLTFIQRVQCT